MTKSFPFQIHNDTDEEGDANHNNSPVPDFPATLLHGKEANDNNHTRHQQLRSDDGGPSFPPQQQEDNVVADYHVKMSNHLETRAQEWQVCFLGCISSSI